MNQKNLVKEKINELLDDGYKDKHEIINKVGKELKVARPTIRRLAGELRIDLIRKLLVLEGKSGVVS